ncbi:DNA-binding protein inhibitor ID-2 [Branchiostoma belcheri]|nr:DNA-binding protein inhibitor ID-2 [Branchiostoma belcheri]
MKPQSPMSALPASEAALRKLHDPIPMKALKTALPSSSGLQSLYNMDMNDCYSKLRELVPTIPSNKKISRIEILQHVIDYIQDLQTALDGHPGVQALSLRYPSRHVLKYMCQQPTTSLTLVRRARYNSGFIFRNITIAAHLCS